MLKKLEWLKHWLKTEAQAIDKLKTKRAATYYWIPTKSYDILPTAKSSKQFAQSGIAIARIIDCDKLFKNLFNSLISAIRRQSTMRFAHTVTPPAVDRNAANA